MKFNDKMQNLYANLSKGGTLTRKELLMCGFNTTDITAMTRNNTLRRVENKKGVYTLVDVKGLYGYGRACLKRGDVLKAMNCLLKCVEYDSTHIEANFQLFGNFIEARDFARATTYLENIYSNETASKKEYEFYVFLMSKILELPSTLQKYAVLYKPERHTSFDPRDEIELTAELEIENLVFQGQYEEARKLLSIDYLNNKSTKNRIIEIMLEEIIRIQNMTISSKNIVVKTTRKNSKPLGNTINDVFDCLMEKDYESAFGTVHNYLESIQKLEYEELVVSLITISILEKDSIYFEPINVLLNINKKDFSFDVHPYIEYYEETLKKGNVPLARAILGVLRHSHALDDYTIENFESKLPKSSLESQKLKYDVNINIDEFYGVEGLQTIIWAIETGISMEEAFARFDATDEQKSLIFLIFAKEAYLKSMFTIGDRYMRMVEKLPKSPQIKEIFRFLTINKKFLKNREINSKPYIILSR